MEHSEGNALGPPPAFLAAIPNALSVVRLVLGLVFAAVPASWRLAVVAVAGVTEYLDGALSRLWHVSSATGRLLDPIADKVFVLAVLTTLVVEGRVSLPELLLIGSRDVMVLAGAAWAAARRGRAALTQMPPTMLGKLTTTGQIVFLLLILLGRGPVRFVFAVTVLLSVAAGLDYLRRGHRGVSPARAAGADRGLNEPDRRPPG
jgi:CDP-diacylglycerol--glycerol-3-phosphate 3-phosphatidyltransferase